MDTDDAVATAGCGCYIAWILIVVVFWFLVLAALWKYVFS
jgi:hypothetical protein